MTTTKTEVCILCGDSYDFTPSNDRPTYNPDKVHIQLKLLTCNKSNKMVEAGLCWYCLWHVLGRARDIVDEEIEQSKSKGA